ncbi:MAG: cation-transporting P-type ATPase [Nanoarchaeota archaeon]|nr:cation-transporting P-type ATPase [Nanoarchaeota archaeon]MBU0977477.1 cation-transporting P-type ATPase [Nanoarchaeota archaeon]
MKKEEAHSSLDPFKELDHKTTGLSQEEAKKRKTRYGPNELKDVSKRTPLKILLAQIKSNFMIYLLFVAAIISILVGKSLTAYTIFAVISLVAVVGFIQEYRSEKAIESLKGMLVPISIVIRDGKEMEILSADVVPGDIVVLRNGEKISADCVILEEKELRVNESVLTGESQEIKKEAVKNPGKYKEINQIFMGTFVVSGRCLAKVTHTGMNTRFGKISSIISTAEKELPLQKKVNKIAKVMAITAIIVSVLTGAIILVESETITPDLLVNVLILVIALSVSAFPEGLPVVLITTLASGARAMAKQNAIVNRMSIIETLGETTVICTDKTGTLTKGEMTVKKIFLDNSIIEVSGTGYSGEGKFSIGGRERSVEKDKVLNLLLKSSVICNDSNIERTGEDSSYHVRGNTTESALLIMAAKAGIFKEDLKFIRKEEIPFSSERKTMAVSCKTAEGNFVYAKGAIEFLLNKCTYIRHKERVFTLTEKEKEKILQANATITSGAFRTLGLAYKKLENPKEKLDEDLVFIGFVAMEDPPREEVRASLEICHKAGISVKMITGDNKETALAIAKQIGLSGKVMGGEELDAITDDELEKIIKDITIFARVKPEDKLRIVRALKNNGEVVTMTGDGVNDAPALKEAHIGVAMGQNGTDVSRSVADLTLKDDNFATIVVAIKEGRTIFKNIKKFVTYQLSCNTAEITILFLGVALAPLLGWQVPLLLALQILFMNLVTDNLPAITLGFNPYSGDAMEHKPRKNRDILNRSMISLLTFNGALLALFTLSVYFISFNIAGHNTAYARTTALVSLIFLEVASAFNFRSFRKGVLNRSPLVNPYLFFASLTSVAAAVLIIYTPLNKLFETVPIGLQGWLVAVFSALLLIIIYDVLKIVNNKKKFIDLEN